MLIANMVAAPKTQGGGRGQIKQRGPSTSLSVRRQSDAQTHTTWGYVEKPTIRSKRWMDEAVRGADSRREE